MAVNLICTASTFDFFEHHLFHVSNLTWAKVDETAEAACRAEGDSAEASTTGMLVSVAVWTVRSAVSS